MTIKKDTANDKSEKEHSSQLNYLSIGRAHVGHAPQHLQTPASRWPELRPFIYLHPAAEVLVVGRLGNQADR